MQIRDERGFELQVCQAFASMPWGPGKVVLGELVIRIAQDSEYLRCPQSQGDGMPCPELEPDCATCQGWVARLQKLAER
ncbi:MAG: hypothetical protein ACUVRE_08730 [Thermoanaerobaculaceae bacterium]